MAPSLSPSPSSLSVTRDHAQQSLGSNGKTRHEKNIWEESRHPPNPVAGHGSTHAARRREGIVTGDDRSQEGSARHPLHPAVAAALPPNDATGIGPTHLGACAEPAALSNHLWWWEQHNSGFRCNPPDPDWQTHLRAALALLNPDGGLRVGSQTMSYPACPNCGQLLARLFALAEMTPLGKLLVPPSAKLVPVARVRNAETAFLDDPANADFSGLGPLGQAADWPGAPATLGTWRYRSHTSGFTRHDPAFAQCSRTGLRADQLERLAQERVSPWHSSHPLEPDHSRKLEELWRATGERGLPMPGGFLLDPLTIARRMPLYEPRSRWDGLLAYHPRFGLVTGYERGAACLRSVSHALSERSLEPPRLGRPYPVASNWRELLDWLFAIGDLEAMPYVSWIRVGDWQIPEHSFPDERWRPFWRVLDEQRRAHLHGLAALYGRAEPAREVLFATSGPLYPRDDDSVCILALDDAALVGCREAADMERAFEYAGGQRLLARPEAWGGEYLGTGEAPREGRIYALASGFSNDYQILVRREGALFDWSLAHAGRPDWGRKVHPNRVPAAEAAILAGASARLERYLGHQGVCRIPSLCSVAGLEHWLSANDGKGWECLLAIEEAFGGLFLGAHSDLAAPDRLGPFLLLQDRESLEWRGLNQPAEPDQFTPRDREQLPWPFVRRLGIDLAVIGLHEPPWDSALCVDRTGTTYLLDQENGRLAVLAEGVLGMLEKRALNRELYGRGSGLMATRPLTVAPEVDWDLARRLELTRVEEASDAVSAYYLGDDILLLTRFAHPAQKAETLVYTRTPTRAVEVTRALRERYPDRTIRVEVSPNHAEPRRLFEDARIEGLVFVRPGDW